MWTFEIISIMEQLKQYYNKEEVLIQSIEDNYDGVRIVTMYGEEFVWNRASKILEKVLTISEGYDIINTSNEGE